ncbi:phosphotransferase enzyme family protein [Nocardioides sp. GXZ039]|uniref:phosphotransferase enzyme family protein n=1 Tax=Nocardioides sp. GXZ039 TaxID=3136018 RepID=UPI0030F42E6A
MSEPVVQMLWEREAPGRVLQERFGFADAAAAARWVGTTTREHWGISVTRCERIVISAGSALAWVTTVSEGRMILKWSVVPELFARLGQIARLTRWLDDRGIPVSAPVPSTSGALQVETAGRAMGLQRVLDGDLLDAADEPSVHAAGATLARLDRALGDYPDAATLGGDGFAESPREAITRWAESAGPHVPAAVSEMLSRLAAEGPDDLPAQLVHGDYRAANLLCAGSEVVAVLDFEEARTEHRVNALARSAVRLGTRFHDWAPVSNRVHERFLAGYEAVQPLTPAERAWWPGLLLWHTAQRVPSGSDPTGWAASTKELLVRA